MKTHATTCPACGYALGGEIPEPDLGKKKDADLPAIDDPEYQIDAYRGENAKAKADAAEAERRAEFARALQRKRAGS